MDIKNMNDSLRTLLHSGVLAASACTAEEELCNFIFSTFYVYFACMGNRDFHLSFYITLSLET